MKKSGTIAIILLCTVIILTAWVLAGENHSAGTTQESKVRIGTFKSQAVAVAYFRSDIFKNYVEKVKNQVDKAQADGDEETAKQLKALLQTMQQTAHMQVFGNAPVDNILKHIEGTFPAIAKQAHVAAIVQQVVYKDPSIELLDVTDLLVKSFNPDEETLRAIKDLSEHPSVDTPPGHPPIKSKGLSE